MTRASSSSIHQMVWPLYYVSLKWNQPRMALCRQRVRFRSFHSSPCEFHESDWILELDLASYGEILPSRTVCPQHQLPRRSETSVAVTSAISATRNPVLRGKSLNDLLQPRPTHSTQPRFARDNALFILARRIPSPQIRRLFGYASLQRCQPTLWEQ
jgi:hypothetical protein